jgi:hypothetical protein
MSDKWSDITLSQPINKSKFPTIGVNALSATTKVSARLLTTHVEWLDEYAEKSDTTRSEVIERAILTLMKQRNKSK